VSIAILSFSQIRVTPSRSTLFPTRRSSDLALVMAVALTTTACAACARGERLARMGTHDPKRRSAAALRAHDEPVGRADRAFAARSEEHTSELQSRAKLVCRLLLEKKK